MKLKVVLLIILAFTLNVDEAALITNVNFVFEVFSAKSMVRFFEFNDAGWNISQDCIQNMYTYLNALQNDIRWSYKC